MSTFGKIVGIMLGAAVYGIVMLFVLGVMAYAWFAFWGGYMHFEPAGVLGVTILLIGALVGAGLALQAWDDAP